MAAEVGKLVDELVAQMESGSYAGYRRAMAALAHEVRRGLPRGRRQRLDTAIGALAPVLPLLSGEFAATAVLAGAMVEWGGSPMPLVETLTERAAEAMAYNAMVPGVWESAAPGRPLPEPVRQNVPKMLAAFATVQWPGSPDVGERVALSWFDMDDWLKPMLTVLLDARFRAAVPPDLLESLRASGAELAGRSQRAAWVGQLASVLDDEPLIVLAPVSESGWALTMSGIGDNHQLHILLADRLIGDPARGLVRGDRPDRRWVAAATTGDPRLDPANAAIRAFRLFDGHGAYVYPEGAPSDIQPLNGTRVLVLHPPNGTLAMGNGRVFQGLPPSLTLDRVLPREEAVDWLTRVQPAVEDDFMAG
ncbi:hypothetical protein [Streptomyces sp. NPDC052192]|uniref:hypothetical protein n=1 Tax=Streptomyces sp. NPDC052192 TaxID=3155052 RepID=UPI00342676B5